MTYCYQAGFISTYSFVSKNTFTHLLINNTKITNSPVKVGIHPCINSQKAENLHERLGYHYNDNNVKSTHRSHNFKTAQIY